MNILEKIVVHKRKEVADRQALYPTKLLEQSVFMHTPCVSMRHYLTRPDLSGVIAEFKRKSPSQGDINPYASVERTTIGYMMAGASALSILTDETFFGGSEEDLKTARQMNYCPILRKDFIIDAYQIIEARAMGADVILLIAAILTPAEVKDLALFTHELGMEVLLEVHDQAELEQVLNEHVDLVGVNNRNLKDFRVDIATSEQLAPLIPSDFVKVAESGLKDPKEVIRLKQAGYEGFLMGQHFMEQDRPEKACKAFVDRLNQLTVQSVTR